MDCYFKKRMGANVGVFAPIHFSWSLSSPQQPLETEDPPTVSLAPQYTSQHLCRAIEIFSRVECSENLSFSGLRPCRRPLRVKIFHSSLGKIFSAGNAFRGYLGIAFRSFFDVSCSRTVGSK